MRARAHLPAKLSSSTGASPGLPAQKESAVVIAPMCMGEDDPSRDERSEVLISMLHIAEGEIKVRATRQTTARAVWLPACGRPCPLAPTKRTPRLCPAPSVRAAHLSPRALCHRQSKDAQIEILNTMIAANERELTNKDDKIDELNQARRPPVGPREAARRH